MKLEIHHRYYLPVDVIDYFKGRFDQISEKLDIMTEQEKLLNEAIGELKTTTSDKAEEILKKLEELENNNPDLTDEIEEIRNLTNAVKSIGDKPVPETDAESEPAEDVEVESSGDLQTDELPEIAPDADDSEAVS